VRGVKDYSTRRANGEKDREDGITLIPSCSGRRGKNTAGEKRKEVGHLRRCLAGGGGEKKDRLTGRTIRSGVESSFMITNISKDEYWKGKGTLVKTEKLKR